MSLPNVTINYLGILLATLFSFVLGFIWYGPKGFGKLWIKLNGFSKKDIEKKNKDNAIRNIVLIVLGTLATVYVLAYISKILTVGGFVGGMKLGILIWVGFFSGTTLLGDVLWEGKPWKLYILNGTFWLINIVVISGIVAVWA